MKGVITTHAGRVYMWIYVRVARTTMQRTRERLFSSPKEHKIRIFQLYTYTACNVAITINYTKLLYRKLSENTNKSTCTMSIMAQP